jgi:fibronectin-binding autotransporter adhesin
MNFKKIFLMLTFFVLIGTMTFAQPYPTVYVNSTNGIIGNNGLSATNDAVGVGPMARIDDALAVIADGGTLVIYGGPYAGGDNAGGDVDINTTSAPDLATGLTIEMRPLPAPFTVALNLTAGGFIFNVPGAVLNIVSTNGAFLNQSSTNVTLTAGNIHLDASTSWVLANNTVISLVDASTFVNAAPTKTSNVSLSYTGGGAAVVAGAEANYGSFGIGTIAVNRSAGTTITFPYAVTTVEGINVTSGGVTFSGAVVVSAGADDVTNAGTDALAFASTLGLGISDGVADANIASIENTSSGSITVAGTTTWTGGALSVNRNFGANYAILNSNIGTVTLGAVALVASDGAANRKYIVEARNSNAGTLTIGLVTAAVTATNTNYGSIRLTGTATAGTINIAGGPYRGFITILGTHTLNITGATSLVSDIIANVDGVLTNAGTINLNADLTLSSIDQDASGTVPHLTNGGVVTGPGKIIVNTATAVTHTFNGGGLGNIEVNTTGTVNFITADFTANTMTLTGGTVGLNIGGTTTNMLVVGAAVTIAGGIVQTVTNFTEDSGSFTLTAAPVTSLIVKGDFNRTGGTFTAGTASLVSFTGTGAQALNPGAAFTVDKLEFNNVGGLITVGNSIRAAGNVIIYTSTQISLNTLNIILMGGTNSLTNNGSYTSVGGGGIIFGGITTVVGGVAGAGYSLLGTGTFSNIIIDAGTSVIAVDAMDAAVSATNPTTVTANAHAFTTGDVILISGNAEIPNGFYAITKTGANTFTVPFDNSLGAGASAAGSLTHFNTVKVTNPVTGVKWNGVLTLKTGALSVATASVDFGPTGSSASITRYPQTAPGIFAITGATFNAANILYDLTYTGALTADQPVGGELTITPANVKTWTVQTTGAFLNNLPANSNVTFGGTLYIENTATVNIPTGTATLFILSGNAKTHTIRGTISFADAGDALSVTGTGVTINGSLTASHPATIGKFTTSAVNLTIANIQSFAGTFTTTGSASVTLGMGASTLVIADQRILGAVTLGGSSFTLASNIDARAGVTLNSGTLNFGAFDLNITTAGNFAQTGGSYTSGGGYLVMNRASATITLTSALPNLKVLADATVAASGTVNHILQIGTDDATPAPTLTLGAFNLTMSGPTILFTGDGSNTILILSDNATTNGGNFIITGGATLTMDQNSTIEELTLNSVNPVTIANLPVTVPLSLFISDEFTQTKGDLHTGINDVELDGDATNNLAYTQTAGNVTSTTDALGNTGWLVFNFGAAAAFAPQGVTIDNLWIADDATNINPTKQVTINKQLDLDNGTFNTGNPATSGNKRLVLNDFVLISMDADNAVLTYLPTFGANVNVFYYNAAAGPGGSPTGNELPNSSSTSLNTLTVDVGGGNWIVLAKDITVNNLLTLSSGSIDNNGFDLNIASGKTIQMDGGSFINAPVVTNYKLLYTATATTTNLEFRNGTGISVDLLTINGTGITVTLGTSRTIKDFSLIKGTFDDGGWTLTVLGNMNAAGGIYTGTGTLALAGTTLQTITAAAAGTSINGNLVLNNPAGFQLAGGNLNMIGNGHVTFTNGIFRTGTFILYLVSPTTGYVSGDPVNRTQGFLGASATSHVLGNVGKVLTNNGGINGSSEAANIFPVGTGTIYRPATLTFNPNFGVPTSPNAAIVVGHVNSSPGGSSGLPIANGVAPGIDVARYPAFYWSIYTVGNVSQSTVFDLSLRATDFTDYDAPANVRIIRRFGTVSDLNNNWLLQGVATGYDNQVNSLTGFTAINRSSQGGLAEAPGAVFTLGVKSNMHVVHPIAKQWLVLTDGTKIYSLVNAFTGNLGTLTFLAQSSNPAVAIATVYLGSSNLRIAPVAIGDANVTITAQDNLNGVIIDKFSYTFAVNVGITDVAAEALPTEFALYQNFPNPFNPTTTIKFDLPKESNVTLKVFNVLGQEVATLVNNVMPAGHQSFSFDASKLSSGMYIYRIQAGDFVQIRKMLLMK